MDHFEARSSRSEDLEEQTSAQKQNVWRSARISWICDGPFSPARGARQGRPGADPRYIRAEPQ
eukprot:9475557-Pyramimonas_sp.AAC.1